MKKIFLLTGLALSINAFAQVPSYVPTNGLVAWYSFTGNANDLSGNGYNGTVNGASLTTDRFGSTNSAYYFNGTSSYIITGATTAPLGANPRTFSLWFNSNTYTNPSNRDAFNWGSLPSGADGERFGFTLYSGLPYFCGQGDDFYGTGFLADSNWHNVIVTYDGDTVKMYVDGNFNTSSKKSLNTDSSIVVIGRSPMDMNGTYFEGSLDDIGIWSRVLTTNEIQSLYNGGLCYQSITVTDTLIINANLTGFNPVTYANTLKVYPNPANNHITINYGNYASLSAYTLKITNSLGQTVFTTSITQQSSYIDLSTWSGNGVYFVNLINASGVTIDVREIVLK